MKNTRKLFMLGLMLLAVAGVNCKDSPAEVKAYEPGSSAIFKSGTLGSKIGTVARTNIAKITITNDSSKVKSGYSGPYELGISSTSTTNGCNLGAYLYKNEGNSSLYDCVIYADVEVIYANANCSSMFSSYTNLKEIVFENFNTSNVTNMSYMFSDCKSLTQLDLSNFNTSKVTNMSWMFAGCAATELDLSNFNTSKVTSMAGMFNKCGNLTELDVSNFDTSKVTGMSNMFNGCENLTELDVSNFNTSNVTGMNSMFSGCVNLTELDVSNFNTSKVEDMRNMFNGCENITELDVSSFDMSNVTKSSDMLSGMTNLEQINAPKELGDNTIELPVTLVDYTTGEPITSLDSSMANKVLAPESDELKAIFDAIDALDTCKDYNQATSIRAQYEALDDTNKQLFASLKNSDGVLLKDKLEYMEYLIEFPPQKSVSGNSLIKTLESNDYNFITIAVLTLTSFIGIVGYYFIQKRKSIKA